MSVIATTSILTSISLAVNDSNPAINDTLKDSSGAAIDLTGATVVFAWKPAPGNPSTQAARTKAATVTGQPTAGTVSVTLAASDNTVVGAFQAAWIITFGGGARLTVPNGGPIPMNVFKDVSQ